MNQSPSTASHLHYLGVIEGAIAHTLNPRVGIARVEAVDEDAALVTVWLEDTGETLRVAAASFATDRTEDLTVDLTGATA
jgi:hypothetical protein